MKIKNDLLIELKPFIEIINRIENYERGVKSEIFWLKLLLIGFITIAGGWIEYNMCVFLGIDVTMIISNFIGIIVIIISLIMYSGIRMFRK